MCEKLSKEIENEPIRKKYYFSTLVYWP